MRLENGRVKPCSTCLKVREAAKGAIESLTGKAPFKHVTTSIGRFVVDSKTHKVVDVDGPDWAQYMGLTVYLSGRIIYNVDTAKQISGLGNIVDVTRREEGTLQ